MKGEYDAKQGTTKLYLQKVRELTECFSHFEIEHIRRKQNKKADALSKLASLTFGHLGKQVLVEVQKERSIEEKQVSDLVVEEGKNSMMHSVSLEVIGSVEHDTLKLYTDGAASSDDCGAGLMLISPEDKEFTYALRFEFEVTNNEAEYEALLAGL